MQSDNTDVVEFVLGYVPKDIAFSLSQICDHPHIFTLQIPSYSKADNRLAVQFDLAANVLRNERQGTKDAYFLTSLPNVMPKSIKAALYCLTKLNIQKHNILELQEEQLTEDVFAGVEINVT